MRTILPFLIVLLGFQGFAEAQGAPRVGRGAASKYFGQRTPDQEEDEQGAKASSYVGNSAASSGPTDHYLALHFGKMMSSTAYEWGTPSKQKDVGDFTGGLTYRVGEWKNSMDLNLRIDFIQFKVAGSGEQKPLKMSILPLITFPDASSKFPLYFGFGAGPGVFFRQTDNEASLTLDYQLIAGARFFDVFENAGFFIETGLKNHLQLWNSGQFNGTFLSAGAVFTF
ncbi:hypothetical protein [Bdellovibrio sp. HCB337]|uniref:hypothetical protein n=1 Tax=Bdellovibrio sp. HCB337 TaxID=3394358 RepID=UPI0039A42E1D